MAIVRPNIRLQRITVQRDDLAKREKVGGVLGATGSLPESIIPKGYFLVFVPSDSAYLSTPTRPRDRVSEREREREHEKSDISLFAPLLPPAKKERKRDRGGGVSFSPTFGRRCSFRPRGVKLWRVAWKKRDTRVLDSPRWARGTFC